MVKGQCYGWPRPHSSPSSEVRKMVNLVKHGTISLQNKSPGCYEQMTFCSSNNHPPIPIQLKRDYNHQQNKGQPERHPRCGQGPGPARDARGGCPGTQQPIPLRRYTQPPLKTVPGSMPNGSRGQGCGVRTHPTFSSPLSNDIGHHVFTGDLQQAESHALRQVGRCDRATHTQRMTLGSGIH